MNKRIALAALCLFVAFQFSAAKNLVTGRITNSATGTGIQGVRVTDGYSWTSTDRNGNYKITPNRDAYVVYYTLPSGYESKLAPGTGHPVFYSPLSHKGKERHNFSLTPLQSEENEFNLVMIADPQAKNERQVKRFVNETVPDVCANIPANSYIFGLGDVVSDSDPTWDLMLQTVSSFKYPDGTPIPFYNAIGNHDHMNYDKDPKYAAERWIRDYGPTDFSLDRGDVHIIVMEDCFNLAPKKNNSVNGVTWRHEGGLSDSQFKWLCEDIRAVPDKERKMVVFCCHIPFQNGSSHGIVSKQRYHDEVLKLLSEFGEAHIMTGHRHRTISHIHKNYICKSGLPVYEHVHASPFGYFWFHNTCSDGTPASYTVYTARGGHMENWYIKSVKYDKSFQMRVYDGTRLEWAEPVKDCMIVDLWGGEEDNWKVELYSRDGRKIGDFTHCNGGVANMVTYKASLKAIGKRTWPNKNVWAKDLKSEGHLWYFKPEGKTASEMKDWEVRATQTIPGGTRRNVYTCTSYTTDDKWF